MAKTKLWTPLTEAVSKVLQKPAEVPEDIEEAENHLKDWVENIPENHLLEQDELHMIRSIVHFSNTLAREIMIPRVELDALDQNTDLMEAARKVLDSGHSRLPVYEDEIDNIIGVLYAKDLLRVMVDGKDVNLRDLLRAPLYVPESKNVGDLLREMRTAGVHMAVVVDEYGGTSGIVSMEDIVEEIVGEIRDEYDENEEVLLTVISPDEYSFLGRIDLDDVNECLDTHLSREAADTLAGYVYSMLEHVPAVGESFDAEGWTFSVESLKGRRIQRVHAERSIIHDKENEDGR